MSTIARSQETPAPQEETAARARTRRPHLIPELLLVFALYELYSIGRYLAAPAGAYAHAESLWRFERWVHLPNEASVQQLALHWPRLVDLANLHYQVGYVISLVGSLVWIYWRHPRYYIWYRRFLTLATGLGLLGQIFYPMAPPRLLPGDDVVDTAVIYGHAVFGPVGTGLANQFAAMPSLHVGWALAVAVGAIVILRSPWRWLFLLHPVLTLAVVVVTGNHYWTDGIVASVIVLVALWISRLWLPQEEPALAP